MHSAATELELGPSICRSKGSKFKLISMKPILVIGATGNVGRHVIANLVDAKVPVRALSRNPGSAALPSEVELVSGDLTVPDSLNPSLAGVDTVFLVWTASATAFAPALERFREKVRRVVFLSAPHKTPHPFFQQPNPMATMHAEIERQIEGSGLEWTYLRPGMFASNVVPWWAGMICAGDVVHWPYAEAATAPIDERDIGAVAARVLCEESHDRGDYVLTGTESLTQSEQVKIIGEVLGRPLRLEEISPEEARTELLMPSPVINMLLNAWAAAVGLPAFVTTSVEEITGTPARTFRDWVADHIADFR